MIRWKIYKDLFVNPSCLTDIMDIQVRIKTHSIYTQFINGPVPPLLERVEFGAYRKVIGSNGKKNGYIYFEYGIGE